MTDINEYLDFTIKILKRAKKCNLILEKLRLLEKNGVWEKGFKESYAAPENEYEKWRKYMHNEIQNCIALILKDEDDHI